tara:strand:- start:253 stop:615 length:363 start_codon:yes stop_codon:yes gene_type:complete
MIKNIKNRKKIIWKIKLIEKNIKNKKSELSDRDKNSSNTTDIIVKIICNRNTNSKYQLYSDLDALPLKLAQFLKKFFIAEVNLIIFFGLSEPEVKVSFRKSKESLFSLIGINLLDGFELK